MADTPTLVYFGAGTLLFFFWAYGIVSFVLDLKNKIVPGIVTYLRGRRRQKQRTDESQEPEERKQGLL